MNKSKNVDKQQEKNPATEIKDFSLLWEDELYSLLYHTLIIKGIIADDYQKKLEILKKKCECFPDLNNNLLTNFLQKNSYDITYPSDLSITIHLENPIIHNYAF